MVYLKATQHTRPARPLDCVDQFTSCAVIVKWQWLNIAPLILIIMSFLFHVFIFS